jgi:flagellar protein FliO/FliZ
MESTDYLRAVLALLFTLSLIGLVAYAVRKFGPGLPGMAGNPANPRLVLLERKVLDARHQLLLFKRDQTEHLVILSTQGPAVVIESQIKGAPTA